MTDKSDLIANLVRAAAASQEAKRQLLELDFALLALVPIEHRDTIRDALFFLKSQFTPPQMTAAFAAIHCRRLTDTLGDDPAVEQTADLFKIEERIVRRAAIERTWTEVNQCVAAILLHEPCSDPAALSDLSQDNTAAANDLQPERKINR